MTVTLTHDADLHRTPSPGDEVIMSIIALGPRPQLSLSKTEKQNNTKQTKNTQQSLSAVVFGFVCLFFPFSISHYHSTVTKTCGTDIRINSTETLKEVAW